MTLYPLHDQQHESLAAQHRRTDVGVAHGGASHLARYRLCQRNDDPDEYLEHRHKGAGRWALRSSPRSVGLPNQLCIKGEFDERARRAINAVATGTELEAAFVNDLTPRLSLTLSRHQYGGSEPGTSIHILDNLTVQGYPLSVRTQSSTGWCCRGTGQPGKAARVDEE
jgi:hypothetical protein